MRIPLLLALGVSTLCPIAACAVGNDGSGPFSSGPTTATTVGSGDSGTADDTAGSEGDPTSSAEGESSSDESSGSSGASSSDESSTDSSGSSSDSSSDESGSGSSSSSSDSSSDSGGEACDQYCNGCDCPSDECTICCAQQDKVDACQGGKCTCF